MTSLSKLLAAAALAAPALASAPAAHAQATGVAVADPQAAIANSKAFQAATAQIQTTYKAQIDQARTRGQQAQAELAPLATAFDAARRAPNANEAALRTQYQNIQTRQQAAQADISRITAPAERAQAYAVEQIQTHLGEAVQNVERSRNIGLIVSPQAVLAMQPAADVTSAITAELDRLVPTVSATPPAGWQPGQNGAAGAAAGVPALAGAPRATGRRNTSGR